MPERDAVIGVDVGGTFTDFVTIRDGRVTVDKRPSTPDDPAEAVLAGLAERDPAARANLAHGTTVATNALLERRGVRTAFVTTRGFGDLLRLGRGDRPELYALHPSDPPCLVADEDVIEVDERLGPGGVVLRALEEVEAARVAREAAERGARAVAVCTLYSFANDAHERALGAALSRVGPATFVSLSSDVLPVMREYERASTTVMNAYLGPIVAAYLDRLREDTAPRNLWVMGSHGGVLPPEAAARLPVATLLSGPAAGVAGAVALARRAGFERVLSFDMGGTSTDVALCEGESPLTDRSEIEGLPVQLPMVAVHTIGAGGGSIVHLDAAGVLRVGPRSAGALPGPACFGRGGQEPTVTDANVVLGRLPDSLRFPGGLRLDRPRAQAAFAPVARRLGLPVREVALAVLAVAEAQMERALRKVSVERGRDPAEAVLLPFGGAGGLHGCALAEALGMSKVLAPHHPGTLSASGLLRSPRAATASRTVLGMAEDAEALAAVWRELGERARRQLEGVALEWRQEELRLRPTAELRYGGQSATLPVPWAEVEEEKDPVAEACRAFELAHERHFGYRLPRRSVEVVTLRMRATLPALHDSLEKSGRATSPQAQDRRDARVVLADGEETRVPVIDVDSLAEGLAGPAIVDHGDATTWLAPGWWAEQRAERGLLLTHLDRERAARRG